MSNDSHKTEPPRKPADALTRTFKIGGKHPGFKKCRACGVAGYMTEKKFVQRLQQGLDSQKFKIVSTADPSKGDVEGTVIGMLRPLFKYIRDKGIIIR